MAAPFSTFSQAVQTAYSAEDVAEMQNHGLSSDQVEENARKKHRSDRKTKVAKSRHYKPPVAAPPPQVVYPYTVQMPPPPGQYDQPYTNNHAMPNAMPSHAAMTAYYPTHPTFAPNVFAPAFGAFPMGIGMNQNINYGSSMMPFISGNGPNYIFNHVQQPPAPLLAQYWQCSNTNDHMQQPGAPPPAQSDQYIDMEDHLQQPSASPLAQFDQSSGTEDHVQQPLASPLAQFDQHSNTEDHIQQPLASPLAQLDQHSDTGDHIQEPPALSPAQYDQFSNTEDEKSQEPLTQQAPPQYVAPAEVEYHPPRAVVKLLPQRLSEWTVLPNEVAEERSDPPYESDPKITEHRSAIDEIFGSSCPTDRTFNEGPISKELLEEFARYGAMDE